MILTKEFSVKVIMLALILHPKSVIIEMTLDPGVNIPMMMILIVWYMRLSTFKTSMLLCLPNGNIMSIFWRSTRSFIVLVNIYLMDLWPTLQVTKLKPICFSFGVDLMGKTSTTISCLMIMRCKILTM